MKGIILAGGKGSRLYPLTSIVCKQLLPIYDKPLIYYPLSVLMIANIKDILIITNPKDTETFQELLGDGSRLGINLTYAVQEKPDGLAKAFIIGEEFIGDDDVCLILGDNIFFGSGFKSMLSQAIEGNEGATIFGYSVHDPERYGVVEFDHDGNAISIEEKPGKPKSNYAIVGLYFYDNDVIKIAKSIKPSARGELEITDVNKVYLEQKKLKVQKFGRGFSWLDTGTPESMAEAALFVETIEKRTGLKIGCIEEIAYRKGFINTKQFEEICEDLKNCDYGQYLFRFKKECYS